MAVDLGLRAYALDMSHDYTDLTPWQWTARESVTLRGRHRAAAAGAPTLYWLSGNGFCAGVYWPFLRNLDARFGLFTHDIEGHGESDPAVEYVGGAATVARIEAVLAERVTADPLVAIGHSLGGGLSLRTVARNPERFAALVLLDPIMMPPMFWLGSHLGRMLGRHPLAVSARRRRRTWRDVDAARERLRGRGIYAGWSDEALECFIRHATRESEAGRVLCCDPELEAQIFEHPLYLWRDIRKLSVPTLLIHGSDTYFFVKPAARKAARLSPQIEAVQLPGGHCFMLEDPTASAELVADWLKEQLGPLPAAAERP